MFVIWIVLILFVSYLISLSIERRIKIDTSLDLESVMKMVSKRDNIKNLVFGLSSLAMFSIWAAISYFSEPPKPFTEKMAQQIIASDDDPGFALCVSSFDTDSESFYSASEVKQVCTCIKEKRRSEKKTYWGTRPLGSDTLYWAECTKYFCQTDSCELVEKYWDSKNREQIRVLEKLLYPL